jgi:hypothetical protein
MKVEFGKYYILKPNGWSPIIGKCTGKSKVEDNVYIFEYYFNDWEGYKTGSGAYNLWAIIEEVSEQEAERYLLPYKLNGDLPVKFLEKISKL